ncbi:LysR substrate-binding domain-containing protein [Pseudomonas idahonensis]|uniref:LysR substrate-binding domain-containing protein n=1 Tax=Pseudomonas TaxID=286 RepID=UPI0027655106|nr:LysR substrate-binding domain-containing protein [Pseudomonas protegens]MDP9501972.1 LysR substrate-binding domain-containing protein [Pseudomonas protegens]
MIELRHLRYFIAIAKFQHMTRAAESLCVTQSTLSHQIKQLETLLGVQLFDRVGRGVELSFSGKAFLEYAIRALREVEEGALALRDIDSPAHGLIRIGGISSYIDSLLPKVVSSLNRRYPNVRVVAEELSAGEVAEALLSGGIDLGISFSESFKLDFQVLPLFVESLVLTVSTLHVFASRTVVDATELTSMNLALQTSRYHSRKLIDELLGHFIDESIKVELGSLDCLLSLVRSNPQIALVHFEHKLRVDPLLVHIPIQNPDATRTAVLMRHPQRRETALQQEVSRLIQAVSSQV